MRRFFLFALLIALPSCRDSSTSIITVRPSVPLVELISAPRNPSLGSQRLDGEAMLSRPFLIVGDGNSLEAVISVSAQDSEALLESVKITRLFVVHESGIWETASLQTSETGEPPQEVGARATGGPGWGIGSSVDVVVRLRGETADSFLMRIPGVMIREIE